MARERARWSQRRPQASRRRLGPARRLRNRGPPSRVSGVHHHQRPPTLAACLRAASSSAWACARRATRELRASKRSRFSAALGAAYRTGSDARGIISMQSTGHGATHSSHPVHSSATTVCICLRMPMIASTGQGGRHLAHPMQRSSSMSATSSGPSTPFAGFSGSAGRPVSSASARIVAAPPGGHWLISAAPLAIASA